jgi:predicted Rossmann fold nucleotide-binding protein DprA/Smf involved in DNA uptake
LVGDLNNLVGGLAPVRQSHGTGAEANLSPTAALVFQVLKEQGIGMHADEIGPRVQLLSRDVLVALLELELLGLVETHASGYLLR